MLGKHCVENLLLFFIVIKIGYLGVFNFNISHNGIGNRTNISAYIHDVA